MLQFNELIGPILKIISKMSNDFINFLILYGILTIMFSTIANMNFLYHVPEYEGMFNSIMTIVDASLGN